MKQVIAAGSTITKASFSIERGLGRTNPAYLLTLDQHCALTLQELPWTPELEEYLLHEQPTQMDHRADERERFANLLGNNLKTIEAQFGRDFTDAVLAELLGEHPEYDLDVTFTLAIATLRPAPLAIARRSCGSQTTRFRLRCLARSPPRHSWSRARRA